MVYKMVLELNFRAIREDHLKGCLGAVYGLWLGNTTVVVIVDYGIRILW